MSSETVSGPSSLARLCNRFELAVANFGRSCIALQSNEKAFQAWFAACVIQEFGLSRVYREVHLDKKSLRDEIRELADHPFMKPLLRGNELFPDLSISWEPAVDTRHTSTRSRALASARTMLSELAIVTEFKVTGSTSVATSYRQVQTDLCKLGLFARVATGSRPTATDQRGLATYMVVLDNFRTPDARPAPRYRREAFSEFLAKTDSQWPAGVKQPATLLLSSGENGYIVHTFDDFRHFRGAHANEVAA